MITSERESFCLSQKWNPRATSLSSTQNYFIWKCWCSESGVLKDEYLVTPGCHFSLESTQFVAPFQPERSTSCSSAMQWVQQTGDLAVHGLWLSRLPGLQRRVGAWRTGIKTHREELSRKILTKTIFHGKLLVQEKEWWFSLTLQGLQWSTVCFLVNSLPPLLSLLNLAVIKILQVEKNSVSQMGSMSSKTVLAAGHQPGFMECRSGSHSRRQGKRYLVDIRAWTPPVMLPSESLEVRRFW